MADEQFDAPSEETAEVVEEEGSAAVEEAAEVAEEVATEVEAEVVYDAPMEAEVIEDVTSDDRLWALLSWLLWPLAVVALLMGDKKTRPFIKYNAWVSIWMGVVVILTSWFCVGTLVWFYSIYLGIKSYQGEMVEVPVISDFVRNQGLAA